MTKILFTSNFFRETNQVRIFSGPGVFALTRWPNCYLTPWVLSNYKKILAQKLYKMPKNWLRRMCGVLRTYFLKVYRSISGINGHLLKNQKKLVIYLSLVCWVGKNHYFGIFGLENPFFKKLLMHVL